MSVGAVGRHFLYSLVTVLAVTMLALFILNGVYARTTPTHHCDKLAKAECVAGYQADHPVR